MIDRLEKFEAPPTHHWLLAAPFLALALWACNIDFESAQTDAKVIKESVAKAEASERTPSVRLPMAHPLGCPEEDEAGRKLRATVSVMGEKRPRCWYGSGK